jgi:transmembrane sensor
MSTRAQTPLPASAARWFARMRDDQRTPQVEAEFNRWLSEDPAHEREYQRLEELWGRVELVRDLPEIKTARSQALIDSQQVAGRAALRVRPAWFLLAGAAAVLVMLALSQFPETSHVYRTAVGNRKTIELADGSELTLNTDSLARVRYTLRSRTIQLERGQAHFKVARSRLRPFLVEAGRGLIRAVGTEFDVYRRDDLVQVTLVEGRVEVTDKAARTLPAQIEAGEQIALSAHGLSDARQVNIPQATAWVEGRLVFDNERLLDAVAEVNRYSATKIIVLDAALADFRVSGVFRTDRADSFVQAVSTSLPVKILPAASGSLIIAPSSD